MMFAIILLVQLIGSSQPAKHGSPRIVEHPESLYVAEQQPATLNCVAEGDPAPIITWYVNGQPIITSNEDPTSHRMVLPSGQLFFLRVSTNKTHKGDVGLYYCNATNPETNVSVISRSASLNIAVLGTEFRQQPKNVEVAVGTTAILECKPPWGEPEPKTKWKKDGEVVRGERTEVSEGGTLRMRDVRKEDAGIYVCVAFNSAGHRDSLPVRLYVKEKPKIVEGPKDVSTTENSDAIFHCRATGDPEPTILWKRIESQISPRRLLILNDKSLRIEKTQLSDSGIYACRAENPFGFQEAEAKLTVHSQPSFLVTPRDKTVGVGKRVTFKCSVTGTPTPAVFWTKEPSQVLMFPRQDYERMSVLDDGTLIIENVEKSDAGDYVCKGLSIAGSAYAKARLEVKDFDSRPPPIINHAPQNQTLPANTMATLHCTASGDPQPIIKWYKNGRSLNMKDDRYVFLESGTLQINDLRKSDSGTYMCKAISETGEASKSCSLQVDVHTNPSIIFYRTPEPSTFPGPPTKLTVQEITETTVRLTWRNNPNQGSSPVFAYTVEYYTHETGEGWIVASDSIKDQFYVVRGLNPDTSYRFLVRAQNSHGLSLPSHVTAPIKTKGSSIAASKPTLSSIELDMVEEKLSNQIITLFPPDVLGSTAIKLTWEVRRSHRFIEGFHIRYRPLPESNEHATDRSLGRGPSNYSVITVESNAATSYTLQHLEKNTWYEVDIQPYHKDFVGEESNSIRVRTLEDVPSAAPQNIKAHMIDNTTLYISWEPPPKQHCNGLLKGFKIYIFGNESKFDREIQINSTLEAVYIQNMIQDMVYKIQMSAFNRIGEGFRSEPIVIGLLSNVPSQNIVNQTWFIVTIIITIGLLLWTFLCILSIWLLRKRKYKGNTTKVPATKYMPTINNFSNNWGMFTSKSYSAMSQNHVHVSSPSYKKPPEPFPTTTINPSIIKQQYMIEPKNESRNFAKENLSSGSTIDTNLMLDFEDKALEESQQYEQIRDSLYIEQQPALFLPPPPEHPPPSDTESLHYNWKEPPPLPEYRIHPASENQQTAVCTLGSTLKKRLPGEVTFFNGSTNPIKYMISNKGTPLSPQLNGSQAYQNSKTSILQHTNLNSPRSEMAVVDSESESDANLSHVGSPLTSDIDTSGNFIENGENSDSFLSMESSDNECIPPSNKNEFSATKFREKNHSKQLKTLDSHILQY